jgi:hypothetical protein
MQNEILLTKVKIALKQERNAKEVFRAHIFSRRKFEASSPKYRKRFSQSLRKEVEKAVRKRRLAQRHFFKLQIARKKIKTNLFRDFYG